MLIHTTTLLLQPFYGSRDFVWDPRILVTHPWSENLGLTVQGPDCNLILHSDKDHQVPFKGGPNMTQTTPRWRPS